MFYVFLTLTVLWFGLMTWLSHQDGEHTSKTSRTLAEHLCFWDKDVDVVNGWLRRLAHVVVFAVFTVLLGLTLRFGELPLWLLAFTAVWSYADEATKPWIEGRHFSWPDVGLNLIGAAVGCAILSFSYLKSL